MKQATIGVLASTAEGFPLVLLEFGLSKVPVICSNVGYCSEIIKDNVNGLLFNPLDSLQMQNQFSKMISDKSLREKLAVALNKSVVNYYSESKVLDILLLQYKQIL
jgi:glycosyltransferase involved in cell wall biosynthesis